MQTPAQHSTVQQLATSGTLPSKRPRSTSIPSSPTGSASSKRAISEDDFADRQIMRAESEGVSGTEGERQEQEEVQKRTEDMHLGEPDAKKYSDLYDELLSATPPPFNDYYRYALIPTSLVKQIKSAAFESATNVQLDMSSLVADEGQEVHVMEPGEEELPSGEKARYPQHKAKKEKVWTLKKGLQEDEDFTYITEDGWNKVTAALDATTQPNLLRFCIRDTIQLSPPIYTLYVVSTSTDTATPIRFTCPTDTSLPIFLRLLQSIAAEVLGSIKSKAIRAWSFDPTMARSNNDASALASLENFYLPPQILPAVNSELVIAGKDAGTEDTCSSKGFENGDAFILELGTKEGANVDWVMDVASAGHAVVKPTINLPPVPKAPAPLFSSPAVYGGSTAASSSSSLAPESGMFTRSRNQREAVKTRGLVGLQNLGNTCFMNSAVQCLSNTPELNKYFLSSVYKDEINRENPLGMHGLIADAFGLAVEQLWSEHPSSSFSPRQLKQYTGKFAPQFQGYGQHDTQEFLAFLLDGLHEDMNRIYKKPYIEKPDWKAGGGDKELALLGKECWDGYKKRNDSVIVDLFQGQLMSTLVCPECHQESITMDPFMYLTVPLPIKQTVEFTAYFVPKDPEKDVVKLNLLISANASFAQIKDKIGALVDADPSHMIGVDLFKGAFYNWWFDGDHNGECKKSDIAVFYDVGVPTTTTRKAVGTIPTDGTITVPVYTCKSNESKYSRSNDTTPTDNCLVPFFITLTRAEAGDAMAVREAVARGYTRCLKQEMVSQLWVPNSSSHAVVPMTPAEEQQLELGTDEEKVAEIHLDGSEHRVVEVPATRSGANSPVHSLKSAHGNLSSTSLATLASTRSAKSSRLVPRADVYKIHVADASTSTGPVESGYSLFSKKERKEEPGVNSIYRGEAGKASAHWSSLESRRKAKKEKGNVLGRLTGGLFGGSDKGDDDEREGRKANGQGSSSRAASPVSGPPQPQLVVRPGEAIFVEWSSKNYNDYIDESVLGQSTTIVDPLIEKERLRRTSGKAISLEECLDEFSKEETLGQDDLWYCPVCKKHQAATKKLDIYKAPDILVICIKRFGSSRRLSDKLDNLVNFPLEGLDLSERVQERRVAKSMKLSKEQGKEYGMDLDWDEVPTEITPEGEGNMVYDLYAVDNHFGGLGGGHYTAFCKNREDGQWWNYDDSRVSRARPESVQSKAAYLLFYRRRTARPIGGISRVKAEEAESLAASRAASRAPSPAPSASGLSGSRTLAPSGLSHAMGNDEEDELASESEAETTDDEGLPSYSRSASPAVSEDGGARVNSDEDDLTSRRLSMAGHNLGFGNNAWDLGGSFRSGGTLNTDGTETAASASGTSIGVNYPFGQSSADTTMVNMPPPPASLTLGEPVREETDTDAEAASAASPAGTTLVDATEGAGEEISEPSTVRAGDRSTGTMTDPQEEATNVSIRPASDMEVDEP